MAFLLTKPLGRAVGVVIVLVVVVGLWFGLQVHPLSGQGRAVIVTVHQGDSLSTVASEMHAKGVIGSPLAYRIDTMIFGAPTITAGSYQIRQNSSFGELSSILSKGPNVEVVSVLPGLTLNEVALSIASDAGNAFAKGFVRDAVRLASSSAFHPNGSLEGLIGPGTYLLIPSETPMALAQKMATRFDHKVAAL